MLGRGPREPRLGAADWSPSASRQGCPGLVACALAASSAGTAAAIRIKVALKSVDMLPLMLSMHLDLAYPTARLMTNLARENPADFDDTRGISFHSLFTTALIGVQAKPTDRIVRIELAEAARRAVKLCDDDGSLPKQIDLAIKRTYDAAVRSKLTVAKVGLVDGAAVDPLSAGTGSVPLARAGGGNFE